LKIAVNTRLLINNKLEGIGYFIYESLKIITKKHPEHQFYFLFDRNYDDSFIFSDNITPIIVGPPARHPVLYYVWFEFSIPSLLKKLGIDLFLSPDGYLSLRSAIPSLAVFHDLNFEHHPKDFPWTERKYYRHFFPRFAKKANRIATVSVFSKNDISKTYQIDQAKIDVVYCGANQIFKPLSEAERKKIKKRFSRSEDYFIYVGSIQSRKNLANLIKAFDLYKSKTAANTFLLMVGALKWSSPSLKSAYKNSPYKSDIIFTGRVEREILAKLTASAKALTLVSKLEGFGIPMIEAYFCDVPVICSNLSSMPEIAGKGALLVNPDSVDSIANALITMDRSPIIRDQLIKEARIQRLQFDWEKTADLLWNSIEKLIKK